MENSSRPGWPNRQIASGLLILFLAALGLAACSDSSDSSSGCQTGIVATTSGQVCGKVTEAAGEQVHAFLGIPFGESTAGENRWQPPAPKTASTSIIHATTFSPGCPQAPNPPYTPPNGTSEDCLTLNIWRRADLPGRTPAPVMVWMHGGSFLSGGSSMPIYDGAYLAATEDVVVVTFNYRLGALGFMAGIHGLTGNYGLMDQQLAMTWVYDNIQNFEGDPAQITIFGESAGAMSVGLHTLSVPSSSGLYRAGIMESNPLGIPYKTVEEAATAAGLLESELGCAGEGLDCLRSISADDIVKAQESAAIQSLSLLGLHLAGFLVWTPVIDGEFLIEDPTIAAQQGALRVPMILGTNHDEGALFVCDIAKALGGTISPLVYMGVLGLIFGSDNAASIISLYGIDPSGDNSENLSKIMSDYLFGCANRFVARQSLAPVYAYEFTETSINVWPDKPACEGKACHADELPFVFHTDRQLGIEFTPEQAKLSDEMGGYWGGFAASLDPNESGNLEWPLFTAEGLEYMILKTPELETAVNPIPNCDFWDTIGYDLRPPQM